MGLSREELKRRASAAIDARREDIVALGDAVFAEPELGYKERRTAAKLAAVFDALGIEYRDGVARTGIVAPLAGGGDAARVAVMAELDAVIAPGHPQADPETGAAHACGHNCMVAALAGVAYALRDAEIMPHLGGGITLMAVPAEEFVELEFRSELRERGEIGLLGGKPEFIRLGELDDVDMLLMQHTEPRAADGKLGTCAYGSNGFLGKLVRYVGKAAHAGGAPHLGINALNAANIGLMAINCLRETFREEDRIRVHPIITKGGDLVNVVPDDVRIETYIRGASREAIEEANRKVDRALRAGADAVGAEVIITDFPGYLPLRPDGRLAELMYGNMAAVLGAENVCLETPPMAASTDAGDVSHLMPVLHAGFAGAEGSAHSAHYEIADKDVAYIAAAKCLAMTAIDLLADGAEQALAVKRDFEPAMTKEQYLREWGKLE